MKIRWSPEAADDLEQIVRRIRLDNAGAAHNVSLSIYDAITSLRKSPLRGRQGHAPGTRELIVTSLPYIVIYRVKHENVEIMRIYHGAQNRM
jgi:addiction module RelE/StbE family toxin